MYQDFDENGSRKRSKKQQLTVLVAANYAANAKTKLFHSTELHFLVVKKMKDGKKEKKKKKRKKEKNILTPMMGEKRRKKRLFLGKISEKMDPF